VRSISLDKWSAGNTQLLVLIGNARSNAIWEEKLNMSTSDDEDGSPPESKVKDSHPLKIAPRASRRQREEFIYAKYVRRDFLGGAMTPDESSRLLYESAREGNLVEMMRAIACGADVNWRNSNDNGKTCLHVACAEGNGLAVELICQWNVNVDIADSSGKTAIDYSAEASHTIIESLVRKLEGDLDQHAQSSEGDMLLQLAEEDRVVANDDGVSNSDRLPADFVLDQAPTERPRRSTSGAPEVRRRSSGGEMLAAAAAIVASALAGRREVDKGEVSTDDEKRVDGNEDTDVATIS
ncbi:GIT2, partial [Symbiodinium microadriaticum]